MSCVHKTSPVHAKATTDAARRNHQGIKRKGLRVLKHRKGRQLSVDQVQGCQTGEVWELRISGLE